MFRRANVVALATWKQICRQNSETIAASATTPFLSATEFTDIIFDLELPEGRCVGLQVDSLLEDNEDWSDSDHPVHSCLHPKEINYALEETSAVKKSFLLGRLAMRASFSNQLQEPCLKDSYGRPTLPEGYVGSISHKGPIGVALSQKSNTLTVGVDIEQLAPKKRSIARKILTERERNQLGNLKHMNISESEEVMLRFSLKEAIYKSIHPVINHYVGFQEAEVTPFENGTATVDWNLTDGTKIERMGISTAHWKKIDQYFLTSASFERKVN